MGLFSRRRTAVAETATWYPAGPPEEFTGEDADMDDDGQATTDEGFWVSEVTFDAPDAPGVASGARIIVSVYVSYGPDEDYAIGLRYQYVTEADPDWSYTGYEADPEGEVFGTVQEAQADAREWAASLAGENGYFREQLPDVFDWWGEAFLAGDAG